MPTWLPRCLLGHMSAYRNSQLLPAHKAYVVSMWWGLIYVNHCTMEGLSSAGNIQGTVLCHHSPRWISLAFGQHPLYLVSDPYICATATHEPCYSSLLSPTLLTSTFCFRPTFAHARAEPPEPRHQLICNRHDYHVCASRSPTLWFYHF